MRDEKDPGTLEMPLKRRRGRPPVGKVAMTPAERARRYRVRRRDSLTQLGHEKLSDASLIEQISRWVRYAYADREDQPVLDMFIEEFVKRHHSSGLDLYPHRKP
ncbi:hypothetical protein GGR77_000136 [Xanthomonas translucens]